MRVTEVMRGNPACCVPTTTARKAAGMMRQVNTGVLLIVDGLASRQLLGVVTDRDLCLRVLADRDPDKTTVQDCMTRNPVCCGPQDEIAEVLAKMAKHHIRRVPVVNAGGTTVEGIITDRDLLENVDIDPHELCVALGRITASTIRTRTADSTAAFP